jgi:uncharacterized protein YdhG (YjbR/CyaY superfamily)
MRGAEELWAIPGLKIETWGTRRFSGTIGAMILAQQESTSGDRGMKKAASGVTVPPTMGPEKAVDVESYLVRCPEPHRTTLEKLRATIRSVVPKEATETISYGMPSFQYKGGLVAYGAFKGHCSFFPMSGRLVEDFADELKAYKTSKGTIQFAVDKPLPAALVKKIVKARIAQNEAKKAYVRAL